MALYQLSPQDYCGKKIPDNDTKAAENLNHSKNNCAISKYHLLTLIHVCFISLWQKIHSEYECRKVKKESVIRESCKNVHTHLIALLYAIIGVL